MMTSSSLGTAILTVSFLLTGSSGGVRIETDSRYWNEDVDQMVPKSWDQEEMTSLNRLAREVGDMKQSIDMESRSLEWKLNRVRREGHNYRGDESNGNRGQFEEGFGDGKKRRVKRDAELKEGVSTTKSPKPPADNSTYHLNPTEFISKQLEIVERSAPKSGSEDPSSPTKSKVSENGTGKVGSQNSTKGPSTEGSASPHNGTASAASHHNGTGSAALHHNGMGGAASHHNGMGSATPQQIATENQKVPFNSFSPVPEAVAPTTNDSHTPPPTTQSIENNLNYKSGDNTTQLEDKSTPSPPQLQPVNETVTATNVSVLCNSQQQNSTATPQLTTEDTDNSTGGTIKSFFKSAWYWITNLF